MNHNDTSVQVMALKGLVHRRHFFQNLYLEKFAIKCYETVLYTI